MTGTVVVLNQFALPRQQGGGTRHTDLFRRVPMPHVIVAGNRNHYSQQTYESSDPTFRLVRVPASGDSLARRLGPWLTYTVKAFAHTIGHRKLGLVYASTPHLLVPVAGWAAARLRRVPFVLEVRDIWPDSLVSAGSIMENSFVYRVLKQLEICLVRSADAVVGVTPKWEDYMVSLGVAPDDYWAVPNGTDLADFAITATREELRREHDISGFTAVFAGAHGPSNGLDRLLDAAAALPDVTFLLVGDGTAKADARERVHRHGLTNVVLRDPVPKAQLPGLLAACDVGVHAVTPLPVLELGMSPNKLFDYLAAGLPVVSNAAGPLADVLGPDECGVLGGPDDLATCISAVRAADESTRMRWLQSAERLMSGTYSRTAAATTLAHAITNAVGQHSDRTGRGASRRRRLLPSRRPMVGAR